MKYYTGTASSHADLKSAIENACVNDLGWSLNNDVLSKNGVYIKLEAEVRNAYNELTLRAGTGQSGSSLTGASPMKASWHDSVGLVTPWPVTYHIHGFTEIADGADEVYAVINYNVDIYALLAFGRSTIADAGGSGAWQCGSGSVNPALNRADAHLFYGSSTSYSSIVGRRGTTEPGYGPPFWGQDAGSTYAGRSGGYVHCAPDGIAYWNECVDSISRVLAPLLHAAPPTLNSANLLFPVKAIVKRSDNRLAIVQQHRFARYLRMDMLQPGEVIEYGLDKWKCYPWYRLNKQEREMSGYTNPTHSGTYGFALAYVDP